MHAHGSDRLRPGAGDEVVLFSKYAKGWTPRTEKTLTSAEFPGTAVLWDEQYFEVVEAAPIGEGVGVRYTLAPWKEEHAIRVTDRYDEESEAHRVIELRSVVSREQKRKATVLLSFAAGHLPARVQEAIASELGVLAPRMTMLSLVPVFAVIVAIVFFMGSNMIDNRVTPFWLILALIYLAIENVIRFHLVWSQSRPIGTAIGGIAYMIWYALAPRSQRRVWPFVNEKGYSTYTTKPDADTALRDTITMREPLLTLLSPAEQTLLKQRFGFDYRKHARGVALFILVSALLGVVTSFYRLQHGGLPTALLSLLLGGWVAVEQVLRLMAFGRGPAGSILAPIVRLLAGKLLD